MGEDSPIYYRIYSKNDGTPVVVEMQWFDEYDYDPERFLSETCFPLREQAEQAIVVPPRTFTVEEVQAKVKIAFDIGHSKGRQSFTYEEAWRLFGQYLFDAV